MSLSIRQLQIVHTVASSGSVTSAAHALGISQPAVSMMLRECSREAGFPMFVRKQGRLQPTAETRILIAELERVFDGIDRIGRLIEDMGDTHVGSIQIAATATLANNILPAAVAAFQASRPRIQITIRTTDNPGVIQSVVRDEVDLGLALSPLAQHDARAVELCTADLVVVVNPTHPLADRTVVEAADLAPYPLISFSRSQPLGALVDQVFRQAGTPRRVAIEVNQSSVACALARGGRRLGHRPVLVDRRTRDRDRLSEIRAEDCVECANPDLAQLVVVAAGASVPRDPQAHRPVFAGTRRSQRGRDQSRCDIAGAFPHPTDWAVRF